MIDIKFKNFTDLDNDELEMVLKWRNSPEIANKMNSTTTIEAQEHIDFIKSLKENSTKLYYLVAKKDSPIGVFSFINIVKGQKAEIGMYLKPELIGSGIGLEMQYYGMKLGYNKFDFNELLATVKKSNIENYLIQIKIGFLLNKIEGDFFKLTLPKENWKGNLLSFREFRKHIILGSTQ